MVTTVLMVMHDDFWITIKLSCTHSLSLGFILVINFFDDSRAKFFEAMAKPVLTPAETARRLREASTRGVPTAVLFGNERAGLTNDEVALADVVVTIPTAGFASLNLGQAVLLLSYEWFKAGAATPSEQIDHGHAQPASRIAIDLYVSLKTAVLQIAGDIAQRVTIETILRASYGGKGSGNTPFAPSKDDDVAYQAKLLGLEAHYSGPDDDDKMVGFLPHCTFNLNGRAASIDTPLHSFIPAKFVDHTHPDAAISIAASRNSQELTKKIYGDDYNEAAVKKITGQSDKVNQLIRQYKNDVDTNTRSQRSCGQHRDPLL